MNPGSLLVGGSSTVGTNHRRRATFTALNEVFKDNSRRVDLFKFCEDFCQTEPKFLVNRFLMRAEQKAKIDEHERQALAKAMYLALAKPYDALTRYPRDLLSDAAQAAIPQPLPAAETKAFEDFSARHNSVSAAPSKPHDSSAAHKVFQTVMAHVANGLYHAYGHRPARVGLALAGATAQSKAETHILSMLIDWIDGDLDEDAIPHLSLDEMRSALRVLYVAACNLTGRDAAAHLLSQALRLASALAEAHRFAPKSLV